MSWSPSFQPIPCDAPAWAATGHAQTIWGHLLPSPVMTEKHETHHLELGEGDRAAIHVYPGQSGRVVYLFHGLGGNSHSSYMRRTAKIARDSFDDTVIMVNHRGCGEGLGLAKQPYHSGRSEDLSTIIAWGRARYPDRRHLAVGFSLSANALLLLMAGVRATALPDHAISVNPPVDLQRCSDLLTQGFNRLYDARFMRDMRRAISARESLEPSLSRIKLGWFTTLQEFDELYTAPYGGFRDRADYYRTCSAAQYLARIEKPTVLLTSEDDPFVDVSAVKNAQVSPSVYVHVEKHGGHMGYISRKPTPFRTRRWLDYALHGYLESMK